MRLLACLLPLALVACQRADSVEPSASKIAHVAAAPAVAARAVAAPTHAAAASPVCGCGVGECGGGGGGGDMCGGGCGGGGDDAPALTAPANATWTALHVSGMHCGGCAKRIERALAAVNGIVGVKVDYSTAKVEVATSSRVDVRTLVASTIDGLGYHVE